MMIRAARGGVGYSLLGGGDGGAGDCSDGGEGGGEEESCGSIANNLPVGSGWPGSNTIYVSRKL